MSDPWSGSVSAKTPVSASERTCGSSAAACSGLPPRRTVARNSPAWALYIVASEAAVRASSKVRNPV
jgi:hypothetical protein